MSKQRKRVLVVASLLVLAAAAVTGGLFRSRDGDRARAQAAAKMPATPPRPPTRFEALPRVIAKIGDKEITKEDLRGVLDTNEPAPEAAQASDQGDDFYETAIWHAAKAEVMNRVLVDEARRRGLTLTAEELKEIELPPAQREQLDEMAAEMGLNGAELVRRREEMRLVEKLVVSEIYDKQEVSEEEMVAVYERETSGFLRPDAFRVRRIFLGAKFAQGQPDADVLARATKLADSLNARGADFAATARKISEADDRREGGLMPDFTIVDPPTKDRDFLTAVMSLQTGQVSPPMRMGDGYQILKMEERLPPRRMTLDEARPMLIKHVQWSKGGPKALAWAEELERKAGAVVLVPMPADVAASREAILRGARP